MIVIAIANQKGGTAKTTTTYMLGYLLAKEGVKTLTIDLDPQASLTMVLGIDPENVENNIKTLFDNYLKRREIDPIDYILLIEDLGFYLIPSTPLLEEYNYKFGAIVGGDLILARILRKMDQNAFDVVLIDTQPSFNHLTFNAMIASNYILAPVETSHLSLGGLTQLFDVFNNILLTNEDLQWLGILPTKFERNNVEAKKNLETLHAIGDHAKIKVYPPVPKSVALEKLMKRVATLDELCKKLKTAKDVEKAYGNVVEDILNLIGKR